MPPTASSAPFRALFWVPAGTSVVLSGGRAYTTRRRVEFTPDDVIAETPEEVTLALTIEGRTWTMAVPVGAIERATTPRPAPAPRRRARAAPSGDLLERLAPGHRLVGAAPRISVPSDNDLHRAYTVLMSASGKAVECTCMDQAVRSGRCKHMRRAELLGPWLAAISALRARGVPPDAIAQAWLMRREQLGVEAAMLRVIAAGQVAGLKTADDLDTEPEEDDDGYETF